MISAMAVPSFMTVAPLGMLTGRSAELRQLEQDFAVR